jgi:hypothetical protein
MKVTRQVELVAKKVRKSESTIWRWRKDGCDISSSVSLKQFLQGEKRRWSANSVQKSEKENASSGPVTDPQELEHVPEPDLNQIELAPVGRRGAAAALQRLEEIEERAHARLLRAIEHGNQFEIKSAQEFYLRASETLRRLDAAVETERRKSDELVPLFLVEQISAQISGWLRSAFETFLTAESVYLIDINNLGEFKAHAIERFKNLLHATVKASLRSDPQPIPPWAAANVIEAWNVPTLQ